MIRNIPITNYLPGGIAFAILLLACNVSPAVAQDEAETLEFSPESRVTVDGTSNRDDWTVTARQVEGFVTLQENNGDAIPEILDAQLTVKSSDLTGEGGSIMNRLMHGALKAREHPDIEYALTSVDTVPDEDNSNHFRVITTGDLTLAGVTNAIEMTLTGSRPADGSYRFQGSHSLLMSDYGIDAPTAMFGSLVTGNEVVVNFDLLTE